jgi:hypothetical protein
MVCTFYWLLYLYHHHHHHRVQEGLGLIPVPGILKMKVVLPSLPRSSYVSSTFWFVIPILFLDIIRSHISFINLPYV